MIASVSSEPFIMFIRFQVKVAHAQRRRRRHFDYIWRVIDKLAVSVCVCGLGWVEFFGGTFMRHLNQLIAHNFPWRENFCVMFNYFHIYVNAFYQSSVSPPLLSPCVSFPQLPIPGESSYARN